MKSIGIDIGPSSVKIAEIEASGKSISIQKVETYPLTSKTESDRELEIITTLKEAIIFFNTDEKTKFVIGLPQNKASLRRLSFPFKEKFKILKSLPFEMEDLTPFSLENSVHEAKVIQRQGLMTEVLAIVLPKEAISKTLDIAHDCGIDPDILSLEGLALNNLFEDIFEPPESLNSSDSSNSSNSSDSIDEFNNEKNEKNEKNDEEAVSSKHLQIKEPKELIHGEAILNLDYESSLLVVRADKKLQTIRKINWGSQNLIQSLASKFSIQPKEAENMLKTSKGVLLRSNRVDGAVGVDGAAGVDGAEPKDLKISEVISKSLEKTAKQIHLTLLEIKGNHQIQVKGIGLMGGMSLIQNIGPCLTHYLQIPCNRILKIKNHPELSMNSLSDVTAGVAIGLAIEAAKRPSQPAINFRREEFSKEGSQFKKLWKEWNFHLKLAGASLVLFFIYAQIRTTLSENLALSTRRSMKDTAEKVLRVKKSQASEKKLQALLRDIEKRESLKVKILDYSKNPPSPLKLLKSISEKAPSRRQFPVDIKKLEISSTHFQMTGITKAAGEIQKFAKSLESLAEGPVNKNTKTIRKNNEDNEGFVEFNISFTPKKGVM